ncbi:hypothetical protein K1T71_013227 [Dendrolimus kikuchii]|uniref:Uncharacterized protein n=1 Tax=Dendrolimus kikuchii TaxID=765133 RepID=A0ACC1CHM3_9NEOP|nr:hypothetical protein K1T71_013227 [Dendrolimus kikuchii]
MEALEYQNSKTPVKYEPIDEGEIQETPPENVWIKAEPIEEEERIEVKCDPFECGEEKTVKMPEVKENARSKRKTREKKSVTEIKTEKPKKTPARKKIRRPLTNFEDVYDSIDTMTLTEEEWQKEHENTLAFLTPLEFVCKDCAMGYNTKESYDEHMKEHSVHLGSYLCELCNTHYQTSEALDEHKQSHYTRYACSFCRTQFKQKETAGCHIIQLHKPDAMFGCCYCSKGFRRVSFLKVHEETCPNKKKIACDVCQKEFKNKIQLALHKRIHKNNRKKVPLTCKICSRNYQCRASLTRHLLSHDLNVTCEECNIVFPNRLILRHHNYEAHNPQNAHKYGEKACPHCPRVCVSSAMLKRHISRMHNDRSRKYECDYCNRLYLTKSDVRSHITWSHLELRREHVCQCGHAFRSPTLLKRHQDKQHGTIKYDFVCSFCGEEFRYKKLLKQHLMLHPEKKLACEKCGLKFQTRAEVKAHKIEHLDEPKETRKEERDARKMEPKVEQIEVNVSPSGMAWRGHKAQRGRPPRVDTQ